MHGRTRPTGEAVLGVEDLHVLLRGIQDLVAGGKELLRHLPQSSLSVAREGSTGISQSVPARQVRLLLWCNFQ